MTEEEPIFSVLNILEEVGEELVILVRTGLVLVEDKQDIITVDVEEEIKVPKEVIIAFVDVLTLVNGSGLDPLEGVSEVSKVGVETEVLGVDRMELALRAWDVNMIELNCGGKVTV